MWDRAGNDADNDDACCWLMNGTGSYGKPSTAADQFFSKSLMLTSSQVKSSSGATRPRGDHPGYSRHVTRQVKSSQVK